MPVYNLYTKIHDKYHCYSINKMTYPDIYITIRLLDLRTKFKLNKLSIYQK